MSKIVKGEGNRAGLHAKIAEPPPIFCKDSESEGNQENLLSKIAEPNPIFYKDSESRAQRQIYLAPVPCIRSNRSHFP